MLPNYIVIWFRTLGCASHGLSTQRSRIPVTEALGQFRLPKETTHHVVHPQNPVGIPLQTQLQPCIELQQVLHQLIASSYAVLAW